MATNTTPKERKFRLTSEERSSWDENGYFVRYDVFTKEENDFLAQIADDIAIGKRSFPDYHIFQNALVRDGKIEAQGIHAMHNIQYVSCNCPEFLARTRDPRLTDPAVDILGPDLLGLNNLYIWKPPRIGLGFPWHQDKWYFNHQYKTGRQSRHGLRLMQRIKKMGVYTLSLAAISVAFVNIRNLKVRNKESLNRRRVLVMKMALR